MRFRHRFGYSSRMLKHVAIVLVLLGSACGKGGDNKAASSKPRDMVAERAKMAELKDQACACTDAACADKAANDLKAYMMTDRGAPPQNESKEAMDKDLAVMTEFIKCLDKARGVTR